MCWWHADRVPTVRHTHTHTHARARTYIHTHGHTHTITHRQHDRDTASRALERHRRTGARAESGAHRQHDRDTDRCMIAMYLHRIESKWIGSITATTVAHTAGMTQGIKPAKGCSRPRAFVHAGARGRARPAARARCGCERKHARRARLRTCSGGKLCGRTVGSARGLRGTPAWLRRHSSGAAHRRRDAHTHTHTHTTTEPRPSAASTTPAGARAWGMGWGQAKPQTPRPRKCRRQGFHAAQRARAPRRRVDRQPRRRRRRERGCKTAISSSPGSCSLPWRRAALAHALRRLGPRVRRSGRKGRSSASQDTRTLWASMHH